MAREPIHVASGTPIAKILVGGRKRIVTPAKIDAIRVAAMKTAVRSGSTNAIA
jgi:hypothetical protein